MRGSDVIHRIVMRGSGVTPLTECAGPNAQGFAYDIKSRDKQEH
jgi:hypothetical protein